MGTIFIKFFVEIQRIDGFRLIINTLTVIGDERNSDIQLCRIREGKKSHLHEAYGTGPAAEGIAVTVLGGVCQFNSRVI